MFERATRECKISPTIATCRFFIFFLCSRIVIASSSACVGCSFAPSPALTIAARLTLASWCGTPALEWRTTIQSGDIASRFKAVSIKVSPFVTAEEETLMLTASAERRLAASSNDVRVRVEASKKRFITVLPRRVGTFFISRWFISRKFSAVSSIPTISSAERLRIPSKSLRRNGLSIFDNKKARDLTLLCKNYFPIEIKVCSTIGGT